LIPFALLSKSDDICEIFSSLSILEEFSWNRTCAEFDLLDQDSGSVLVTACIDHEEVTTGSRLDQWILEPLRNWTHKV
jgi:hypothetical protein